MRHDGCMKTRKVRRQFHVPDDLSERLEKYASQPGSSRTTTFTDALQHWLERRAGNELEEKFGTRLDRFSRAQERMDQKIRFVTEALGIFIQHQLTLVAHHPPFDDETARLGLERHRPLLDLAGRRIARADQSSFRKALPKVDRNGDG